MEIGFWVASVDEESARIRRRRRNRVRPTGLRGVPAHGGVAHATVGGRGHWIKLCRPARGRAMHWPRRGE
jgi:hypothetical protein